jgi:hypothetical protein
MVLVYVAHAIAAGPGIVFESSWDTAIGLAANAVKDGGKWPNYWEFQRRLQRAAAVGVSGGVSGHTRSASNSEARRFAANLQSTISLHHRPTTTSYYMKNDDTSSAGDHIAPWIPISIRT